MVRYVDSEEELLGIVMHIRDQLPDEQTAVPDAEVAGIVKWAREKRSTALMAI